MAVSEAETVLALDIGGTKMLAALVAGREVVETSRMPTPAGGNPDEWLAALFGEISAWRGRYRKVGVAVSGVVDDGLWSPLNRRTLDIPDRFPLVASVRRLSGRDAVLAANDAQAAAWGEYSYGAGQGVDMVFLTISTGLGGGIVVNGRLLGGMAGNFGQFRGLDEAAGTLEDSVTGRWMAAEAAAYLPGATARDVFEAAGTHDWAKSIVTTSAGRTAVLCRNLQVALDPRRIVIGGGIGLAPGYLEAVRAALSSLPLRLMPQLHAATLGESAGVVGIASLSNQEDQSGGN